jgi:hypothetical protein
MFLLMTLVPPKLRLNPDGQAKLTNIYGNLIVGSMIEERMSLPIFPNNSFFP